MKNLNLVILMVFASVAVYADPAIFTKGEMTIPEGAVITDDSATYFTDITLAYDGEGAMVITGARSNPLVQVDTVDILVMESFPLQVSIAVSGNLSVPCVELLSPAVSYADNNFMVVLAETVLGPAESCIAVIEPFQTTVALDVLDLPAGTYTVNVNGITAEFTFDMDNSALI